MRRAPPAPCTRCGSRLPLPPAAAGTSPSLPPPLRAVYFDRDPLGRRGFTPVGLMGWGGRGALLIAVVLNFVTGQTRIATAQSGREEVQQNARGALEMVARDLRGAGAGGAAARRRG